MVDDSFISMLISRLAFQSPNMLVYFLGAIYALMCLKKCKGPAILALLGCLFLMLTTLVFLGVNVYLAQAMRSGKFTITEYSTANNVVGVLSGLSHAAGIGMLIFAVFIGRKRPETPF